MLSLIVAVSKNRVMGVDGKLPWHIPEDLKHFRQLTTGGVIIMGRKTFDSLPKVLPNRMHVVLTTQQPKINDPNVRWTSSVSEALKTATSFGRDVFVVGGAEIYEQFFPYVDYIFETVIQTDVCGDTYFKSVDNKEWLLLYPMHVESNPPCVFNVYGRKE